MRLFLPIILSLFISISANGQEKNLDKLIVGFACNIGAEPSPLVEKMSKLIKEKKYSKISSFLNSKNSGELYLSIIILERLADKNLYSLNEKQKILISRIKSSNIIVVNCLGCFIEHTTMKKLFEKENSILEINWLNKMIPIK